LRVFNEATTVKQSKLEEIAMKRSILILLSLIALLSLTACSENSTSPTGTAAVDKSRPLGLDTPREGAPAPGGMTIAEIAEAEGFTLLLAAIGYIVETNPESELVAGLLDRSQLTVFAPTDQAFIDLVTVLDNAFDEFDANDPFGSIDELLGAGTVEAVVSYHVTEGRRASNSVVPPRGERVIETLLEGATFSVTTDAEILAVGNTASIVLPNVSASNGIIHVINAVILPVDLGL
jgi:uncharacterized surface protein with fasciclin (FAS1) repeats